MRPFALFLSIAFSTSAAAGTIDALVRDARGAAVRDAVVYAIPERLPVSMVKRTATMDQRDRTFIPHVLPVQTGTSVNFPNSDDVRHHVYSFSPAKTFQLPLYKSEPSNPVVFDKAGIVALGCNIHDRMTAFIVVVNTPYFAKSETDGRLSIPDLPPGRYAVSVWYPDIRKMIPPATINVVGVERHELNFSGTGVTVAADSASR